MAIEITIPRLGWSMDEGTFVEWLKNDGDFVSGGDMLFELEGEKAIQEIESFDSGYLCIPDDAPQPGTTVKVGEVIGFLLTKEESSPDSVCIRSPSPTSPQRQAVSAERSEPATNAVPAAQRPAGPAARRLARKFGIDLDDVETPDPTGRVLCEDVHRAAAPRREGTSDGMRVRHPVATPRARRRAQEFGIDWTRLDGTGRHGRIRERDVLAALNAQDASGAVNVQETAPTEPGRFVTASKLRQTIAQRMTAGVHQAAPVTLTTKGNAKALVSYRERLKAEALEDIVPTYNDIIIFHTARVLRDMPELNACWYRNGIHIYDSIHIATAVDTSSGLLAPVVRHADQLTPRQVAEQTRGLIAQARSGQLNQSQLSGGTFTISNLGMLGVDAFTPILNLPQAAILGIGRIVEEPVVRNGHLEAGKTLTLSLTIDHRVVDGAAAARFLQKLTSGLEKPAPA